MIVDILTHFHIIETLYAAGKTQAIVTELSFKDIVVLFAKFLWVWVAVPMTLFLWFKAGALYVTAEGSSEKLKKAHESIRVSVIWTVVAVFVYGLLMTLADGLKGLL